MAHIFLQAENANFDPSLNQIEDQELRLGLARYQLSADGEFTAQRRRLARFIDGRYQHMATADLRAVLGRSDGTPAVRDLLAEPWTPGKDHNLRQRMVEQLDRMRLRPLNPYPGTSRPLEMTERELMEWCDRLKIREGKTLDRMEMIEMLYNYTFRRYPLLPVTLQRRFARKNGHKVRGMSDVDLLACLCGRPARADTVAAGGSKKRNRTAGDDPKGRELKKQKKGKAERYTDGRASEFPARFEGVVPVPQLRWTRRSANNPFDGLASSKGRWVASAWISGVKDPERPRWDFIAGRSKKLDMESADDYCRLLQQRLDHGQGPDISIVASTEQTKLGIGAGSVPATGISKRRLTEENCTSQRMVLLPLLVPSDEHWMLLSIFPGSGLVGVYDSLSRLTPEDRVKVRGIVSTIYGSLRTGKEDVTAEWRVTDAWATTAESERWAEQAAKASEESERARKAADEKADAEDRLKPSCKSVSRRLTPGLPFPGHYECYQNVALQALMHCGPFIENVWNHHEHGPEAPERETCLRCFLARLACAMWGSHYDGTLPEEKGARRTAKRKQRSSRIARLITEDLPWLMNGWHGSDGIKEVQLDRPGASDAERAKVSAMNGDGDSAAAVRGQQDAQMLLRWLITTWYSEDGAGSGGRFERTMALRTCRVVPFCSECKTSHSQVERDPIAHVELSTEETISLNGGEMTLTDIMATRRTAVRQARCTSAGDNDSSRPNHVTYTQLHTAPDAFVMTINNPHGDAVGIKTQQLNPARIASELDLRGWQAEDHEDQDVEYDLRTVLYHSGSDRTGGHYVMTTRTLTGSASDWEHINDMRIVPQGNHLPSSEQWAPSMMLFVRKSWRPTGDPWGGSDDEDEGGGDGGDEEDDRSSAPKGAGAEDSGIWMLWTMRHLLEATPLSSTEVSVRADAVRDHVRQELALESLLRDPFCSPGLPTAPQPSQHKDGETGDPSSGEAGDPSSGEVRNGWTSFKGVVPSPLPS